jgi:hypothetical protein
MSGMNTALRERSRAIFQLIRMLYMQTPDGPIGLIGSVPAGIGGWWQPFKKARAFVHRLGLKSHADWIKYCASGKKPHDIPSAPASVYAKAGWVNLGDWLGTGTVAPILREYQSFKRARAFAHNLGLKSWAEWREYCRSGSKPGDIPAKPYRTYAEAGWTSMGDWLGTNKRRRGADWRPFNKARAFVRSIGLKSTTEWGEYCHSGKRPADIPANPSSVYANDGWVGHSDWFGNGRVPRDGYRSFKEARTFVRARRLKTEAEWREYCRSGNKPADIPAGPSSVYASDGWVGWGDWLGTGRVAHGGQRSFKDARAFV